MSPLATGLGVGSTSWLRALVFCLAVVLCYANSLHAPLLMDDPQPGVTLDYTTRPLVWASFDLNRALSGEDTWSFHVFNALVHLGAGFLLFGVLRRSTVHVAPELAAGPRDGLAFVTTLLWLCHPLQTESVTYLSQRAESMAAFFYLAVLYGFLRSVSAARPGRWQALALVSLALGFATKETIATAPLVVLLFDALFLARGPRQALRLRKRFYGGVAVLALVLFAIFIVPLLFSEHKPTAGFKLAAFGPLEYARTEPGVLLHYLRLVFWPHPLCFDYGWPAAQELGDYLPQTLGIMALLAATVVLCFRRSWIGFSGACFFLILAPTSSIVPIQDPAYEHRMYLPLAAVLVVVVAGAWWLLRRLSGAGWVAPLAAGAAALALATVTIRRNRDYRSMVVLMEVTVATVPHHARARNNLGNALIAEDRTEEAIPVLYEALKLAPNEGFIYLNLGTAYLALKQFDRAIPLLQRAVEMVDDMHSHQALGFAFFMKGDHAAAVPEFEKALEQDPGNAFLHCRLAGALGGLERSEEAVQHFQEALRIEPEIQEAHLQVSKLLVELGRASEALSHSLEALQIAPNSADELLQLGRTFRALGRLDDALTAFQEAILLDPEAVEPCAEFAETVCTKADASLEQRREALSLARKANEMADPARPGYAELCARAQALLDKSIADQAVPTPQDTSAAIARLEQALQENPADADAHIRLARTLGQARRAEEAVRHYEEALRLAPERQDAHINLAALLSEQGRPAEALEHSLKALEILPNSAEEPFNVGQALRALGRYDEAMAAFLEASRMVPDMPEPYAAYAKAVCMKPDATDDERREALRQAVKANEMTNSTRPDLLEICAQAHAALGEYARAAELVEVALKLPGPAKNQAFASRLRAQREEYLHGAGE